MNEALEKIGFFLIMVVIIAVTIGPEAIHNFFDVLLNGAK